MTKWVDSEPSLQSNPTFTKRFRTSTKLLLHVRFDPSILDYRTLPSVVGLGYCTICLDGRPLGRRYFMCPSYAGTGMNKRLKTTIYVHGLVHNCQHSDRFTVKNVKDHMLSMGQRIVTLFYL